MKLLSSARGSNIWSQPVDGGPLRQLTHFEDARIVRHEWSHDGRSLLFSRGTTNNDVVIMANPRGQRQDQRE